MLFNKLLMEFCEKLCRYEDFSDLLSYTKAEREFNKNPITYSQEEILEMFDIKLKGDN